VRVREHIDDFAVRCLPRRIRVRHARAFSLARVAAASACAARQRNEGPSATNVVVIDG
jgi:hypothetical protein